MHKKKLVSENLLLPALAHELRTPLNAIGGWVEIMGTDSQNLSTLQQKALDGIERAVTQQIRILDELQGQRLAAESGQEEKATTDLFDCIVRCAANGDTPITLRAEGSPEPVSCRDSNSLAQTVSLLTETLSRVGPDIVWLIDSVKRADVQPGEPGRTLQLVATIPGERTPDLTTDATLMAAAEPHRLFELQDFPRQLLAAWRIGTGLDSAGVALSVSGNRLTLTPTSTLI